jgi:hypothetical protein
MTAETTQVILILVTLAVAGYALYRSFQAGETISVGGVVSELKEARPVAEELLNVATIGVQAAEQLKNTGRLPDNDAAFQYALNYVKKWFPGSSEIDNEDIVAAIESAVLVANALAKEAGLSGAKLN